MAPEPDQVVALEAPVDAQQEAAENLVVSSTSTSSPPSSADAEPTPLRLEAFQSQSSLLEIDRSIHRALPRARQDSASGGVGMNRSGHRRARRHGSLDMTSAAAALPDSYNASVRLPLQTHPRRGSNASGCPGGGMIAPPPTTLGRAETDGGAPIRPQTQAQHVSAVSASMRTPLPQTSEVQTTPVTSTATSSPADIVFQETAGLGKANGPCVQERARDETAGRTDRTESPNQQHDEEASVGAASIHSFSSSSSSTSSGGLLLADYPRFLPSEVHLGQILGKGSFGIVREVLAFEIDDEPQTSTKGGYQSTSTRKLGNFDRIVPIWASSVRSIASGGTSSSRRAAAPRSVSVDVAPSSSIGGTSNDAASRDAFTLPTSVGGASGSHDRVTYTAPLKNQTTGRRSSFRQPGDRTNDEKERRVSISLSEIAIDIDSDEDAAANDSSPDHHRNRKTSLCSSLGSMSQYIDDPLGENPIDDPSGARSNRRRAKKRGSIRSVQSCISSARSIAFGIDGRTFLARHCIRETGKNAGDTSMRRLKSQNGLRGQEQQSRSSLVSHGSHESTGGSDSATRDRVLARLGLAPSISSSGGSRFIFKSKKKGLLRRKGEGDCRYAVKSLRDEVLGNPDVLEMALLDIQNETRILASVEHPNIVKMRAFCAEIGDKEEEEEGGNGEHKGMKFTANRGPRGYFIVLDRLYDTLQQRTGVWSFRLQKAKHPRGWLTRSKVQREIWEQRLVVAYDLASALNYLHSMGIAYRDLKPQNCAFDVRGDIKLYDFGLSKELNLTDMSANGTFEPSSVVGALRYMPPEVFYGEPYNLSVDTFSFSVLLWEILSLEKPYGEFGLGPAGHQRQVIDGGLRPPLPEYWSEPLCEMMRLAWSADISVRPPMSTVLGTLKWELASVRDDMAEGIITHDRRRSTFVMMKKHSRSNLEAGSNTEKRRSIFRKMKA